MSKEKSLAERRVEQFIRMGFAPVRWAHHPQEIRDAIRRACMIPLIKMCYRNSQKLLLSERIDGSLAGRLTYHEGWVQTEGALFPIEHGWLRLDGDIVDLTLGDDGREVIYLAERKVEAKQVIATIVSRGSYGPIDQAAIWNLGTELFGPTFCGETMHKVTEAMAASFEEEHR